jgi:hypothetical protein
MSDRLALTHAIEDAGIERSKAENVATAIAHFIEGGVATTQLDAAKAELKADLYGAKAELKADLDVAKAELKADIEGVKTDLKATEAALHAALASEVVRLDTRIERLDANVERIGDRTFHRLGVLMTVLAGILFAALQLWPPR